MSEREEWSKLVAPIVAKFEVGANFGERVCFNKDGADALGKLLKKMAEKLDLADLLLDVANVPLTNAEQMPRSEK